MSSFATRTCLLLALAAAGSGLRAAEQPKPETRPAPGAVRQNLRKLWLDSVSAPTGKTSVDLREAVERVRGMRLSPDAGSRRAAAVGPTTRPAASQPATTRPAVGATTQPADGRRHLPKEVVEQLRKLPAAGLACPVELADELYRNGYLSGAFVLYERALAGSTEKDTQAWLLYQMANCRRPSDPSAAEKLYQRVLAEHAGSAWAGAATVERKLLQWHKAHQPAELLKKIESIGPSAALPAGGTEATSRPASGKALNG